MALPRRKNKSRAESRTICYDHIAVTADTTVKLWKVPAGRSFRVTRAFYNNPTGLAQDAANTFNIKILNAALVAASWDTTTGQQGTLTADTPVDLVLSATDANRVLPAGTVLSLFLDETGTATLPAGRVVIEGDLF